MFVPLSLVSGMAADIGSTLFKWVSEGNASCECACVHLLTCRLVGVPAGATDVVQC